VLENLDDKIHGDDGGFTYKGFKVAEYPRSYGMSSLGIAFVEGIVSLRDSDGSVGVLTSIEIFCQRQRDIRYIGY